MVVGTKGKKVVVVQVVALSRTRFIRSHTVRISVLCIHINALLEVQPRSRHNGEYIMENQSTVLSNKADYF